jgi:DNA-binding MarR family transcriptional regulator
MTTNETAARLRRAITRMNRKLRYSALTGVTPAQASILASIDKLERPSLGDLAIAEQVQPPSITKLVRGMGSWDSSTRSRTRSTAVARAFA